jgi:hypothetical protein
MESNEYPITFLDYVITVPTPGIIMFDSEMKPEQLCVRDGDMFEVIITNGVIKFRGVSRKEI